MIRIDISNNRVWVSDDVYYYILDLKRRLEWYEKEFEKKEKKRNDLPLDVKVDIYKSLMQIDTDNNYKNLVKLLEEIAEFRITNKIEDKDKVIVLLPEKSIFSKIFIEGGSNE